MTARPQIAAVLAALTNHNAAWWQEMLTRTTIRVEFTAAGVALVALPEFGTAIVHHWITTDPAEAWERLQACDLIPLDYCGRFVCGACDGTGITPVRNDGTRGGWLCACHEEALPYANTLPDLVAWASVGFAARDDGSPGILGAEEMARASQPCPFAWKVADEPKWWRTINTPNAARLRASGLSWWTAEGRVVIAVPPL